MSYKTFKIKLGLAALVVSLLLSGCSDQQYKRNTGNNSGYDMPPGYSQQFAVEMLGYSMVGLQGPDPSCHIYLIQAPASIEIDRVALQEKAYSLSGQEQSEVRDSKVVEERAAVIRGQEVTLLVSEGINSEDQPYRQVNAAYEGQNGPALVSLSAPVDLWDWDLVDSFLASLK